MTNIVKFASKRTKQSVSTPPTINTFSQALEEDISRLCDSFDGGIDRDKAVQIASDFYNKYPMLMEWVRSPEYMLRKE